MNKEKKALLKTLTETPVDHWIKNHPQTKERFLFPVEARTIYTFKNPPRVLQQLVLTLAIIWALPAVIYLFNKIGSIVSSPPVKDDISVWVVVGYFLLGQILLYFWLMTFIDASNRFRSTVARLDNVNVEALTSWLKLNNITLDYNNYKPVYEALINSSIERPTEVRYVKGTTAYGKEIWLIKTVDNSISLKNSQKAPNQPQPIPLQKTQPPQKLSTKTSLREQEAAACGVFMILFTTLFATLLFGSVGRRR